MEYNRKLILENGSEFYGYGFGAQLDTVFEVVFNTSMVGYQEIISDPSYTFQAVVMTYPLIGNYGMNEDDYETDVPTIGGLIVREYNDEPSNFRSSATLSEIMFKHHIPGICGVDTREITRIIRDYGSMKGMITDIHTSVKEGIRRMQTTFIPKDAVARVSCKKPWYAPVSNRKYHVVAVDCGMKRNIVRSLNQRNCDVTIVPWNTSAEKIRLLHPDGIFISNGPGNPEDVYPVIDMVKNLRGQYPMFGICLGHQIIALAYGADTYKLKFGHRGGNHPVKNLETGKIEITSQNHSYAVDKESITDTDLTITHLNLLDDTVEGIKCEKDRIFAVQYHPESAPGPQDSGYLFDQFISMMQEGTYNG